MQTVTNLRIKLNGTVVNPDASYVSVLAYAASYGNIEAVKVQQLISHMYKHCANVKGLIDISTLNPDVSVKLNFENSNESFLIQDIIKFYLGFVLYIY